MALPSTAIPLSDSQYSEQNGLPSTAIPLNQEQSNNNSNQSQNDSEESPLSNFPKFNQQSDSSTQFQATPQKSPLNFGDMIAMSAYQGDSVGQQKYLQGLNKWKFVEKSPDGKSFMVGNDPNNLTLVDAGNIGDSALRMLGSMVSQIPSMAGMAAGAAGGAALGTAIAPGPGTLIGGLLGAGAGAYAGESTKNATIGYDPAKAQTDQLISAAFGTTGEALGQAVQFGAKNWLKPQVAAALDAAVEKGGNIPKSTAWIAKVSNFLGGVDKDEMMAAPKYGGFRAISANKGAWNKDYIDEVAKGVSQQAAQKEGLAGSALDAATKSLYDSNPTANIGTEETLNGLVQRLTDSTILHSSEPQAGTSMEDQFSKIFKFRDDVPSNLQPKDMEKYLLRLGAKKLEDGSFGIPKAVSIPLRDAVEAKKIYGRTFWNKNYDPEIGQIFKSSLYGEGPTPRYPNDYGGLRSAINDFAKNNNGSEYVLANENYSNLKAAFNGEIKSGLNKFNAPNWMDVTNPMSVADYLSKINKLDEFGRQAISNLKNVIGGDFDIKAGQYGVAQSISKAHPQLLRLSVIASLLGKFGLGGQNVERLPAAFFLGSPTGIKTLSTTMERGAAMGHIGNRILAKMADAASSKSGRTVLSQLLKTTTGK